MPRLGQTQCPRTCAQPRPGHQGDAFARLGWARADPHHRRALVPPRVTFITAPTAAEFRRGLATMELLVCAFLEQGQAFVCLVAENGQPPLPHQTTMAAPPPCRRACARDRPRPPLTLPRPRACMPQPRQSPCSPEARAPPPLSPRTATPTRHCRVVAAPTPQRRVRGVASLRCTHGRTHTPVTALDRMEAAPDLGDTDKRGPDVSN